MSSPLAKLSTAAILCLVLLRLAAGWHFFNEGVKKLEPGFSSAGFLRGATGPLAPLYRGMVTGPHGAYAILNRPAENGSRDAETAAAVDAWRSDYAKRAAAAINAGEPLPSDIDPNAPGAEWVERIRSDWQEALTRVSRLSGVGEEQLAAAEAARDAKLGEVVNYLHGEGPAIDELRHEAWRLKQLREESRKAPTPSQIELMKKKEAEIWATMQPWARSIEAIEANYAERVADLTAASGASPKRVEAALAERTTLGWVDFVVTWTVIGVGVCLFFGLLTPLAAILGVGFLLSVMLSQPPWAPDANTEYFFYQLVEIAAFLVLAATAAGQWAGIDGLYYQLRRRFGDLSPRYQTVAPLPNG